MRRTIYGQLNDTVKVITKTLCYIRIYKDYPGYGGGGASCGPVMAIACS